jgi:hypothetical protein
MESFSPDLIEQPEALQLVLNRVFHFRELQLNPRRAQVCSSSASMSAEVTSTLVTGSAVTTTRRTGVGEQTI